ncbi:putative amidohydrolase [Mycolicibacterium sp. BK556]|uniref:nitrilase-related carbon-nitrogen hydrolase n=1 Tax=unclassified Mycolicibacterium TaxID=2636767 RepID=UPI0016117EBC|nr:putative amidohydrolase [Mycolicibacterium sp. BK556]MBB3636507.1 putative amidohydrolase [Mycolicibacterium sp. BK607]MBB3754406.1 putative amidohydrolase [Mycolicibacterium sp. BK634]
MTRIACAQIDPTIGAVSANVELSAGVVADAVGQGADVVVLPELATSGYMFADADEARSAALRPDDPAFDAWRSAAGDAIVIGGFCELGDDGLLYNSAVALDRDGVIATYRKTHLWDREKLIFTPGAELPPVLKTRHGAIAVMVCYDLEFGEVTRRVALDGAELVAAPVNWPLFPRPDGERPGEVITAMSTARLNRVVVAVCDRAGVERGQPWTEGSVIVDPDGWVVAEVGPGAGLVIADVDLAATRDKTLTEYVDLLSDRRTDLY